MADYATLLRDHVTLNVRGIDRLFLQAYQPQLQSPGQIAWSLRQRGFPFPSSAALEKIGENAADIKQWASSQSVPVCYFKKCAWPCESTRWWPAKVRTLDRLT